MVQTGGEPQLYQLFSVVWLSWGQPIEVKRMEVLQYWKEYPTIKALGVTESDEE